MPRGSQLRESRDSAAGMPPTPESSTEVKGGVRSCRSFSLRQNLRNDGVGIIERLGARPIHEAERFENLHRVLLKNPEAAVNVGPLTEFLGQQFAQFSVSGLAFGIFTSINHFNSL